MNAELQELKDSLKRSEEQRMIEKGKNDEHLATLLATKIQADNDVAASREQQRLAEEKRLTLEAERVWNQKHIDLRYQAEMADASKKAEAATTEHEASQLKIAQLERSLHQLNKGRDESSSGSSSESESASESEEEQPARKRETPQATKASLGGTLLSTNRASSSHRPQRASTNNEAVDQTLEAYRNNKLVPTDRSKRDRSEEQDEKSKRRREKKASKQIEGEFGEKYFDKKDRDDRDKGGGRSGSSARYNTGRDGKSSYSRNNNQSSSQQSERKNYNSSSRQRGGAFGRGDVSEADEDQESESEDERQAHAVAVNTMNTLPQYVGDKTVIHSKQGSSRHGGSQHGSNHPSLETEDEGWTLRLMVNGQMKTLERVTKAMYDNYQLTQNKNVIAKEWEHMPPMLLPKKGNYRRPTGAKPVLRATTTNITVEAIKEFIAEIINHAGGHTPGIMFQILCDYTMVEDEDLREFVKDHLTTANFRVGKEGGVVTFPNIDINGEPEEAQLALVTALINSWLYVFFATLIRKESDGTKDNAIKAELNKIKLLTPHYGSWQIVNQRMDKKISQLKNKSGCEKDVIIDLMISNTASFYNCKEISDVFRAEQPEDPEETSTGRAKCMMKILDKLAIRYQIDMRRDVDTSQMKEVSATRENKLKEQSKSRESTPARDNRGRDRDRDRSRDRDYSYTRDRSNDRREGDRRSSIAVNSTRASGRDRSRDRSADRYRQPKASTDSRRRDRSADRKTVHDMPTKHDRDSQRDREEFHADTKAFLLFEQEHPAKCHTLQQHWEDSDKQDFMETHEINCRSLMESHPELVAKAEDRAHDGVPCKHCGQPTAVNGGSDVVPREHTEAMCHCVNPLTQQLEAWRVLRFYGSSPNAVHMILDSIKTKGAFKTKPNLFNDFFKEIERETQKRAARKQEWVLSNRNNSTPNSNRSEGFQRYGPGNGGR
jgi:hypothetical protein